MFFAIIFIITALLVWCDWILYKRYLRPRSAWVKWLVGLSLIVANLLPYITMSLLLIFNVSNLVPGMWLLTIYTVLSASRIALYCGLLTIKNCYAKWSVGLLLCTIVAWVLIVGVVRTRKELTVKRLDVASTRVPNSFDGYRIVFFSDLHIGTLTSPKKMCEALVAKINALDADLVLFGGDLVNLCYDELTPELASVLGGIKARDGVVAVLGNHDTGFYMRDTVAYPLAESMSKLTERIRSMGWRVSDDSTELLVRGCDTLTLTGLGFKPELIDFRYSAGIESVDLRPLYEGVSPDKFNITVSHFPQLWHNVAATGFGDLVLSGHVHAMQMKGTIGERSFSPAQLMYREWSGSYKKQNSNLYITDGIGSVGFHLRLGAPPEITELTLRKVD